MRQRENLYEGGYPLCVYDEAVYKLKGIGVNVVTHMIIGLPHETTEDMKKYGAPYS